MKNIMNERKKIEEESIKRDIEDTDVLKYQENKKELIKEQEKKQSWESIDKEYENKISNVSSKKILKDEDDENQVVNPKKKFIINFIKFIIWLILLFACFQYLESHPAEKTSMVSGFQMIYERASIFVQGIITGESDYLEDKYKLQKAYLELINTLKNSDCQIDEELKQSLNKKYVELKALDIKSYKTKQQDYYDFFVVFNQLLKQKCK